MNTFLEIQIRNMIMYLSAFKQACENASKEDDGKISKHESKILQHIQKATKAYENELLKTIK